MKKLSVLIASILLVALPAHAVEQVGEQFVIGPPDFQEKGIGVVIEDSQFVKNQFTMLQSWGDRAPGTVMKSADLNWCKSFGDKNCGPNDALMYKTSFGFCNDQITFDCVQSLSIKDVNGVVHQAKFLRDFPSEQKDFYKGDTSVNLPNGGNNFLVEVPGAPHSHGSLYLVAANIDGQKENRESKFRIVDFRVGVFAVTIEPGNYDPAQSMDRLQGPPETQVGMFAYKRIASYAQEGRYAPCAQVTKTECALAWPLPLDNSINIKMKLRTKLTGWLHGRVNEVGAELSTAADGDQLLTVIGKPSVVPAVYAWFKQSEEPKSVTDFYATDPRKYSGGTGFGSTSTTKSILKDYIGYTENFFKEAIAWFDAIGDKAPLSATQWSFRTIENGSLDSRCNPGPNSLFGIVTTNSTMFIANPPYFNKSDMTLDYKVSSPHYLPDGTVFKGMYNLQIRGDYARCIYGYTSAPLSATVSILSSDGTNQVATTTLIEKNGWLFLSANGFTFSSPVLKVKFSQPKNDTTQNQDKGRDSSSGSPTAIPNSKQTITCVKGKTTKRITSVNPKCPVGYKKK